MVVLRCTQKLLVRLKQADNLATVESTTRLGDWYGNILQLGRRQHLLFISERSRLPVVIPIREGKRLASVFPDTVCEVLSNVGVAASDIADERSRRLRVARSLPVKLMIPTSLMLLPGLMLMFYAPGLLRMLDDLSGRLT